MIEFLEQLFQTDIENAAIIILNLILFESLLSVDNAAVLATMVMDLKPAERARALRYGIIGAYVFRGLCLLFAAWLVKIWWLKPLGGLYLIYLAWDFFASKRAARVAVGATGDGSDSVLDADLDNEDDILNKENKWFYRISNGLIGQFWATVVAVEIMDLAFSLDNVFAAVAYTKNIYLICIGVFIGILAMRFVAQYFVRLLERYPYLEYSAFVVIALLGLKLLVPAVVHLLGHHELAKAMESEHVDQWFSLITAGFFFVPMLSSRLLGFPKRGV